MGGRSGPPIPPPNRLDDLRGRRHSPELEREILQMHRSVLRKEFVDGFKRVDVFVTPTLPFTATPCGATKVVIENNPEEDMLSAIMQFTGVPSLAGLPALSVPVGFDADGLPVGMQVIGRPFDEATLFRLGHAYQHATDWHTRAPSL